MSEDSTSHPTRESVPLTRQALLRLRRQSGGVEAVLPEEWDDGVQRAASETKGQQAPSDELKARRISDQRWDYPNPGRGTGMPQRQDSKLSGWFSYKKLDSQLLERKSSQDIQTDGDYEGYQKSADAEDGSERSHGPVASQVDGARETKALGGVQRSSSLPLSDREVLPPEPSEHFLQDGQRNSTVPSYFPPYRHVNGIKELGAYVSASNYIVSFGGPAIPDTKYGIVIVPVGEEKVLFPQHQNVPITPPEPGLKLHLMSETLQESSSKAGGTGPENNECDPSRTTLGLAHLLKSEGSIRGRQEEAVTENVTSPATQPENSRQIDLEQPEEGELVSAEAKRALDALFPQKKRSRGFRQLVKPFFDRPKRASTTSKSIEDEVTRRSMLLEIAKLATILANSDPPGPARTNSSIQDGLQDEPPATR